jgi:hypothetical protein
VAKALSRTVAVITKIDLASARDKVEQKIMGTAPDNVELPNGCITKEGRTEEYIDV